MVLKSKLSNDEFSSVERDIIATTAAEKLRYEQLDKDSKIMVDQLRSLDKKRLVRKIGSIDKKTLSKTCAIAQRLLSAD